MADTSITVRLIDEASRGLRDIDDGVDRIDRSASSLTKTFNGLKTAALGFVAAVASKATLDFVDTVQSLDNKLKLVSKSQAEFADNYETVFKIAQKTATPLGETVDLFSKLSRAQDTARISGKEVAVVTENFNKLLAISGATGPAASGAITQFAQALQSGKFQGDEFRSIADTIPDILNKVSKFSGIAREDLKEYASKGLLTAEVVSLALVDATKQINDEFGRTGRTVGQAITQLKNSFTDLGRAFMEQTGSADALVSVIDFVRENLRDLTDIAKVAGIALAGLAVVFAPVTAALVAAGAAVVYFAKELAPLARVILDVLGKALDLVIPQLAGFGAAIKALLNFENPFDAYAEAAKKSEVEIAKNKTAQESLGKTTKDLVETTNDSAVAQDRKAEALRRAGITAAQAKNEYTDFINKLQQEITLSRLDSDEKERQKLVYEAFTAEAKRQKVSVEELSATRKQQITDEVNGLVDSLQANKKYAEEVKKLVDDIKKKREDYDKFLKDSQTANLSQEQKYGEDVQRIVNDYNDGIITSEEKKNEILKALRDNYQRSDIEALRNYRSSNLTEVEAYNESLRKINEKYNTDDLRSSEGYAAAKTLLLKQAQDKTANDAKSYRDSERNAEQVYADTIRDINEKRNAGLIANDEDYRTLQRKANKSYIESTVSEYNNLYNYLGDKLSGLLGVSKEKWGLITDVVKLFGIDTNSILKETFAVGIKFLKDFATSGSTDISGFTSIFDKVFKQDATSSIGGFVEAGLNLLKGFGSSISSIFSGIGNFFSGLFNSSGSGGLFGTITSFASSALNVFSSWGSSVVSAVSGAFSTVVGAASSAASSIGAALGVGGAAAAGTAAATGGAAAIGGTAAAAIGAAELGGTAAALTGGAAAAAGGTAAAVGAAELIGGAAAAGGAAAGGTAAAVGAAELGGAAAASGGITSALGTLGIAGLAVGAIALIGNYISRRREANRFKGAQRDAENIMAAVAGLTGQGIGYRLPNESSIQYGLMSEGIDKWKTNTLDSAFLKDRFYNILEKYKLIKYGDLAFWWSTIGEEEYNKSLMFVSGGRDDDEVKVVPNAKGGVLRGPIAFPLGGGDMGLAGEAGPEGILPLGRTSDGRLGVISAGGSDGMNINFTINAVDATGIEELLMRNRSLITNIVRSGVAQRGVKI